MNALYPSCLQQSLPHSSFKLIDRKSAEHSLLERNLKFANARFFHDILMKHSTGFHVKVQLIYSQEANLIRNLDFSGFPEKRKVIETDLCTTQQIAAQTYSRNLQNEPTKLVSTASYTHPQEYSDFSSNILYLIIEHGAIVLNLIQAVSYKSYPYMRDYSLKLQRERGNTPSKVLGKILKSCGNNIADKYHHKTEKQRMIREGKRNKTSPK